MKQQETKQYLLTIEVDIDTLIETYRDGDDSIQLYDLPSIDEIVLFECGWLSQSGIQVKQIEEVEE